jgi:ribose transport system substrate-binding protein
MAYYGTDDDVCGRLIMQLLAKEMGDKGVIAILAGNQNAPNLQRRVQAVRDELKNHPNIKEIDIGAVYHEETPEKAAEKVQEIQRINPQITGWAMVGGWPLFTRDALPWPAGSVKVVAVDALPAELTYLEDGHVQVLLAQDCYGWGYKSVKLLLDKIVKGETPKETRVIDPLAQVTKGDVATWEENWKKWLKQ